MQNENWFVPVKLSSSESLYSPKGVIILYQCNFSSSDQLDISLVQYDTYLFLVIFPLALQFSQSFIFRSHRDNFMKFLKIITLSFFLVNNSRQFCTYYFAVKSEGCPAKSPDVCKCFFQFSLLSIIICYIFLHTAFLSSRILAINLTPIKFFSNKNTWLLVVSIEKHI